MISLKKVTYYSIVCGCCIIYLTLPSGRYLSFQIIYSTSNVTMNNRHMLLTAGASVRRINSQEMEFLGERAYVFVTVLDAAKLSSDGFRSRLHSH